MNTWDKKVKVDKKFVPKRYVLRYYKKLWRESPIFRNILKKKGSFIRATYGRKSVIRRKEVKISNIDDLEKVIKEHAVEFHVPTKKMKYKTYLDIDLPKSMVPNKRRIARSIIKKLKQNDVNVSLVTDAPSGAHVFSNTSKEKFVKALKEISEKDKKFHIGKSSKSKIVLDPYEPNVAVPGSLSSTGKPYKRWKKI